MEKLSEEQLNKFIAYWGDGIRQGGTEEILSCLLELKQLRAEKKNNSNGFPSRTIVKGSF